jgi:hypothetical protein
MTGRGVRKRLVDARRRLKERLYAQFGSLIRNEFDDEGQAEAFGLVKRLTDLEQADGPGSLERVLGHMPPEMARQIRQALWRLLNEGTESTEEARG